VSVIICTYNYADFIEEAIESVLRQDSFADDTEIVVIDDGSTDSTAQKLSLHKDRIVYIYKDNTGPTDSLNVGIKNATGEIIALLDADDSWRSDKLKYVVSEFKKSERLDVVYHYMHVVDKENSIIGLSPDPQTEKGIYFKKRPLQDYLDGTISFSPPTSAIAVRKECLEKICPLPTEDHLLRMNFDIYIRYLLPLYAREFALIKKPLSNYRIHSSSVWASASQAAKKEREIALLSFIEKHVEKHMRKLNYNPCLLKQRFSFNKAREEIALLNSQGKIPRAFLKALLLKEFPSDNRFLFKIIKKIDTLLLAFLPHSAYIWLSRRYTSSILFDLTHCFLVSGRHKQ